MTLIDVVTGCVRALELYALVGGAFAVAFVLWGVGRVDPAARDASWGFRLVVLPGTAALWPLLLARWVRAAGPPTERNAHRDAARASEERA